MVMFKEIFTNSWKQDIRGRNECAGSNSDWVYLALGLDQSGMDTMGLIKINMLNPTNNKTTPTTTPLADNNSIPNINHNKLTGRDMLKLSTGYTDKNMWLDWVTSTAMKKGLSDCLACASARPTLTLAPAPLFPTIDRPDLNAC